MLDVRCPGCAKLLQVVETATDCDSVCPACGVVFRPEQAQQRLAPSRCDPVTFPGCASPIAVTTSVLSTDPLSDDVLPTIGAGIVPVAPYRPHGLNWLLCLCGLLVGLIVGTIGGGLIGGAVFRLSGRPGPGENFVALRDLAEMVLTGAMFGGICGTVGGTITGCFVSQRRRKPH